MLLVLVLSAVDIEVVVLDVVLELRKLELVAEVVSEVPLFVAVHPPVYSQAFTLVSIV
jgi:hypothetical protein